LDNLAIILHFEFQKNRDVDMGRRMWEYNAAMDTVENKPVYSILVYLTKEEHKEEEKEDTLVGSPYVRVIPGTGMGHHFAFQVIKLWELPPEILKQPDFEALLPLLPLTKGGKNLETVDEMITELVARNRSDLLELGHFLAGLIFNDENDKQWLKERFNKVLDIIEDSWVYQETIQKGLKKGLEQGLEQGREEGLEQGRQQGIQAMQQTAISVVATRFPELEQLARAIIAVISDVNRLQMLIVELSTASSQEQVKHLLLSLVSAA
jgi:predicted transposase YdaD